MSFILTSIVSSRLSKKQIKAICELKNQQWRYKIKSQINWYKKNIKRNDIHNLFYIDTKLIGYTLLRKRTCNINKMRKELKYLLFDTLIIDKKHRGKKLSNLMMSFNNTIIKQSGFSSFLICSNKLVSFYKKNNWKRLNKKAFNIADYPFSSTGMVFNEKEDIKRYIFYINS